MQHAHAETEDVEADPLTRVADHMQRRMYLGRGNIMRCLDMALDAVDLQFSQFLRSSGSNSDEVQSYKVCVPTSGCVARTPCKKAHRADDLANRSTGLSGVDLPTFD